MTELVAKGSLDRLPERYRKRAKDIANRVRDIDAMLVPSGPAIAGEAVVRMFRQFMPQPGVDPSEMAVEYRAACVDLPAWAITEAANDFCWGRVETHTGIFMPTSAQFAKRARSIMVPFLAERSALRTEASKLVERAEDDRRRHLVEMERANPAIRGRVAALLDQASAGGAKRQALTHTGLNQEAQARIDALKKPPRQFVSKIAETRIGKGEVRGGR